MTPETKKAKQSPKFKFKWSFAIHLSYNNPLLIIIIIKMLFAKYTQMGQAGTNTNLYETESEELEIWTKKNIVIKGNVS